MNECCDELPTRHVLVMTRPQEEQANLLGELAMLRNYKHPHLVEFIGTAMAVERGADTVRQTRQSAARPLPHLSCCGAEKGHNGHGLQMYHYAAAARPPFCKYCCSDDPVCPSAWVQQCRTTELACDEAAAAAATALFAVQVMVAMELCTNGALREALKLNISWPLKVITFYSLRFPIA